MLFIAKLIIYIIDIISVFYSSSEEPVDSERDVRFLKFNPAIKYLFKIANRNLGLMC